MNKIDEIISGMQTAKLPSDYWINSDIEFPELKASHLVIQHRLLGGQSVRDHTMAVIDSLTIKNPITLLSGLFHDLGKNYVALDLSLNCDNSVSEVAVKQLNIFYQVWRKKLDGSSSRFPDHAIKSAYIAKIRLTEWGASSYLIDRVVRIVKTHMYDIVGIVGEKTIRKFIAEIGLDNLKNWFAVRKADSASYSQYGKYKGHIIDPFYSNVMEYLDQLPRERSPEQLQTDPNMDISGKEHKSNDTFLSTEGV